jgi:multicomponent Na+:H+ antiporter subunit F
MNEGLVNGGAMSGDAAGSLSIVTIIVLSMLCIALFLAFLRLLRGPTLPDRVVALDLIALLSVGFIAIYDIVTNDTVFLDVALALALIAFVGTVAFARYMEREAKP